MAWGSSTSATMRDPTAWTLAGGASPEAISGTVSLSEAESLCRRIAAGHYENFAIATRLVPRRMRQDLANVYAFARWSDDLADELPGGRCGEAIDALAAWRGRLERCFAGRPDHPVFIALHDTAERRGLGIEPFTHLLDAFEQDQRVVRYATRDDLLAYCRRSADPVGRIVLAIGGCHEPDRIAESDAICSGLQLVNFWQDIRRDRLAGRVYVPAEDMARFGVAEQDLDTAQASPAVRALVADEVAWARELFDSGAPLLSSAPQVLRPAIGLFLGGGRALAEAIERQGHDTLSRRPVVGRLAKARLAAAAVARRISAIGSGSGGGCG